MLVNSGCIHVNWSTINTHQNVPRHLCDSKEYVCHHQAGLDRPYLQMMLRECGGLVKHPSVD